MTLLVINITVSSGAIDTSLLKEVLREDEFSDFGEEVVASICSCAMEANELFPSGYIPGVKASSTVQFTIYIGIHCSGQKWKAIHSEEARLKTPIFGPGRLDTT